MLGDQLRPAQVGKLLPHCAGKLRGLQDGVVCLQDGVLCLLHVRATSYHRPRWVSGQQTADALLVCPTSTQELRLDLHLVKEPHLAEASLN